MKKLCLLICSLLFVNAVFGQVNVNTRTDSSLYAIETIDGNEFVGYITFQDADIIKLNTAILGEVEIKRTMIKSIMMIDSKNIKGGEYWPENVQSTRYFWNPSAFGLREGEGYYQNTWIFFNQIAVGVTDNFSIGAGMVPLFLFSGASTPIWVTPKFSIPIQEDKFNLGGGALVGTILGEDVGGFGIAYGIGTVGDRDQNLTFGVGYGFADGGWADSPTITVSGMIRTGKKGYILTENWFFGTGGSSNVGVFSLGGRRMLKKASIDFGLFMPGSTGGGFVALPWLGVIFPFGQDIEKAVPNVYFENN